MKYKHNKCVGLLETESILIELGLSVTPLLFGKDIDYFIFLGLTQHVVTSKTSTVGHIISKRRLALDVMRRGRRCL